MQRNGDKWNKINISDTAVFSEKKGVSLETELFLPASFMLYICRYIEPSSQIDNTKACIAVSRGIEVHGEGAVDEDLSINLLSYLILHPLKTSLGLFFMSHFRL